MAGIKNTRDVVLRSARCRTPGLFFVGPYGARVSFASQQLRALNLVWALYQQKTLVEGRAADVAVIGGGIAGLMTAAALLMKGCSVFLFEAKGSVLSLQESAHHRMVHPSINFWPEERLAWTTDLPFFDWFAGSSVAVVDSMRSEWEDCFAHKLAEIEDNSTVSGFRWDDGTSRLHVQVEGADHLDVDVALVATGFGAEDTMGDAAQTGYWKHNEIDEYSRRKGVHVAVSGTGDGGIIEALRLTYPGFMENETALDYLLLEDREPLREQIRTLEREAEQEDDPAVRAELYAARYTRIAKSRSRDAKDLLPDVVAGKHPVLLVGRLPRPFEIGAAPIHKLILAHSLDRGRILYGQGRLRRGRGANGAYSVTRPDGSRLALTDHKVFVRHGATPPIVDFIGKPGVKALRANQHLVGDFLSIDGMPRDFFDNPSIYPPRGPRSPGFVRRRKPLASKLLRTRFMLDVGVEVLEDATMRFRARRLGDRLGAPGASADLPTDLFGIDLAPPHGALPDADHLVARTS